MSVVERKPGVDSKTRRAREVEGTGVGGGIPWPGMASGLSEKLDGWKNLWRPPDGWT